MKKLSEMNGMKIYSDRARYVGTIQDAVIDEKEGKVVGLVFERSAEKAFSVPYDSITAIGDIILVSSKKEDRSVPA